MQEHARGHAHGAGHHQHAAAAPAPGRATQHEEHAAAAKGRVGAAKSVFDAYKPPGDPQSAKDHANTAKEVARELGGDADKAKHDHEHDEHEQHEHDDLDADAGASSAHGNGHGHKGDDKGKGHDHEAGKPNKARSSSGGEVHIITRAGLRHLRHGGRDGRAAARLLYNNPNAYIVLKEGQTVPRGWKAKATILFPSYTEFEAAWKAGRVPKFIDAVVYDNEHWAQTPREEKTHAVHYARLFGQLADKLGLTFIAAPTRKWFAADARFADIIDVQLQSREVHTESYAKALRHDAKLAHRLNPDIKVVAQISSNRNHLDPDHSGNIGAGIHKAERDIVQNSEYIDGFWGYLYQQNKKSIKAGQTILEDLADKRRKGVDI